MTTGKVSSAGTVSEGAADSAPVRPADENTARRTPASQPPDAPPSSVTRDTSVVLGAAAFAVMCLLHGSGKRVERHP